MLLFVTIVSNSITIIIIAISSIIIIIMILKFLEGLLVAHVLLQIRLPGSHTLPEGPQRGLVAVFGPSLKPRGELELQGDVERVPFDALEDDSDGLRSGLGCLQDHRKLLLDLSLLKKASVSQLPSVRQVIPPDY